jgi:hypothetical protein
MTFITPAVGQRWRWVCVDGKSDIIVEMTHVTSYRAHWICVQVLKKYFEQDAIGQTSSEELYMMQKKDKEFIYLFGQDKPI